MHPRIGIKISLAINLSLIFITTSFSLLRLAGVQLNTARADNLTVCSIGCVYTSIQAAVEAANDGDIIKVAAGTFTDVHERFSPIETTVVSQVVYISKSITIQGGYTHTDWMTPDPNANLTVVDAHGQGRAIYISGTRDDVITSTISGLHITGGNANNSPLTAGGGIYAVGAVITLTDNKVFSNTANRGGGLFLFGSKGLLMRNTIQFNEGDGGGVSLQSGIYTLSNNSIVSNTGVYGGGGVIIEYSQSVVEDNTIANNVADCLGGGLFFSDTSAMLNGNKIISNSTITDNCFGGGGIYFFRSKGIWTNNLIAKNRSDRGSALVAEGSEAELLHSTIANNTGSGSGVYIASSHTSPFSKSTVIFTNTILVSHTVGVSVTAENTATLAATLWGSNEWANQTDWDGTGVIITDSINLWDNPGFQNPDKNDYHLKETSRAIDQGINSSVNQDIDGNWRPFGLGYDIGADEFMFDLQMYLPFVMHQ